MYVYLQAYQQNVDAAHPLVAFVTFYRGQTKAFETPPMQVTESLDNRLKTMPLKFSFPLAKAAARRISVPGDRARSDRGESRVLAGPGDARAVRLDSASLLPRDFCAVLQELFVIPQIQVVLGANVFLKARAFPQHQGRMKGPRLG